MATRELFDKKFVIAAIVLGGIYALIVVLIGIMIGKDAAGVAGVALTALATALFKKYETLQFRRMSDGESAWVDVPPINIWRITTIAFTFGGAEYILGVATSLLPETWISDWRIVFLNVGGTLFVYFILSFVVAKAFINLRYSTVAFAVFLTQILSILIAAVRFRSVVAYLLQYGLGPTLGAQGALWLIFEVVALLGVRIGLPSRRAEDLAGGPAFE
jgi:hypothetical protein